MGQVIDSKRRRLLGAALTTAGWAAVGGLSRVQASQRLPTPPQSKGPFYPVQLPLDKDNDLVSVAGRPTIARGEISYVVGRVVDERGRPVQHARIEIWQCDAHGRYHHPRDRRNAPLDPNFQGYGRFITGADGTYRFRTIKPVPYPGRAPHIHFAISGPDFEPLITQMYVAGAPENDRDFLLNSISDPKLRQQVIVAFEKVTDIQGTELIGNFDIVLAADGRFRG